MLSNFASKSNSKHAKNGNDNNKLHVAAILNDTTDDQITQLVLSDWKPTKHGNSGKKK